LDSRRARIVYVTSLLSLLPSTRYIVILL